MTDDVILNKCATIERCINRVLEEWENAGKDFDSDYTRQDAAILNIQRACEAAIDSGQYLIRKNHWGVPQSARDVFTLLSENDAISQDLAEAMKNMVGFRNIAVHSYQALALPVVKAIIEHHLTDFTVFRQHLLQRA
ncbi:MAG: DUF86 domain-containing protein [Natronospirillum sp.]